MKAIFIASSDILILFIHYPYFFFFSHSPDMPENEATFAISGGGIIDSKE